VNIIAVVLGVVNLVVAGPPVMRTVPTDTENVQESGLVALGAEDTALGSSTNRYIMWNKYSAGTSTCNLHDSGQKLDVKRIPHGCSGVANGTKVVWDGGSSMGDVMSFSYGCDAKCTTCSSGMVVENARFGTCLSVVPGEQWSFYPSSTLPCVGPGNRSKTVGTEVVITEFTDAICSFDSNPHAALHSRVVPTTNGCIRDVDPAHAQTFYDLNYISKGAETWFNGVLGCTDSSCKICHTVIQGWKESACRTHTGGGSGTATKGFRIQRVAVLAGCGTVKPLKPQSQASALGWVGGGLGLLAIVWFGINATPAVKKCFQSTQYERIEG